MRVNLLLLSGLILVLATGAFHTALAQDSAALARQNRQLLKAQDSLTTVIEHYRTINEKYYELAKESRSVTTLIWSIVGVGSLIALVLTLRQVYVNTPKIARTEVAKLVKLNQRSFEGIIALYGNHYDYLKNKTIWVVEPHEASNDEKSIARFLRKLGFDKVESIHPDKLSSYSGKPNMILLNNESRTFSTDEENWANSFQQLRNKLNNKSILFWYDTNDIRFPTNIKKSNHANSRYTLYNNIIESFRVQGIK